MTDSGEWPKAWDDICHQYDHYEAVSDSHRVHTGTLYIEEGDDEWWSLKQYVRSVTSDDID